MEMCLLAKNETIFVLTTVATEFMFPAQDMSLLFLFCTEAMRIVRHVNEGVFYFYFDTVRHTYLNKTDLNIRHFNVLVYEMC